MNRRTLLALVGSFAASGCLSSVPGVGPPIDAGCPSLADEADSLCAHTAFDPPLELRPSSWQLSSGSNVSLRFELSNESETAARFATVPSLKQRVDDEWKHVWPMLMPKLTNRLEPGTSFSWEFTFYKEETAFDTDERVELFALDPGTYATVLVAELGDRTVQCVAPFEVETGENVTTTERTE